MQDSKLFIVSLPESESNTTSIVVEFLEFSPGILKAYIQVTDLCFAFSSAVIKITLQLTFGFLVMLFIFCVYIVQKCLSKLVPRKLDCAQLKGKLVQAFIFTVLFSYQKLVIGCFALVQCVDIRNQAVLFLQGDIHCYTWWQIGILVYIGMSVTPIFFVLGHAPFYVKDKEMSVRTFILACLFPFPVMMWNHLRRLLSKNISGDIPKNHEVQHLEMVECPVKHYTMDIAKEIVERVTSFNEGDCPNKTYKKSLLEIETQQELDSVEDVMDNSTERFSDVSQQISEGENDDIIWIKQSDTRSIVTCKSDKIGNSVDFQEIEASSNKDSCAEEIVECLLKHYKCLSVFDIRFTWLGVHKIYRVALVACRTFITEPVAKLYAMSALVVIMTALNAMIKPYKDKRANMTATLSYIANLCIAGISLVKAHLVAFGCNTNCQYRDTVVAYMGTVEDAFLLYAPFVALGLWVACMGLQKCLNKHK